jgi:hypothetical protein
MGPAAEGDVLRNLDQTDIHFYGSTFTVLKTIGTDKCLPAIDKLTKHSNGFVVAEARTTLQAIRARLGR